MNDELALTVKAAGELQGPIGEFADAVGRSRLTDEIIQMLVDEIRYRRAPRRAKLLARATAKIRETGLRPEDVIDDPLLSGVGRLLLTAMDYGSFEGDKDMQERWANLLANGVVGTQEVPPAYPEILREMEPIEAQFLDHLFDADELCVLGDILNDETLKPRHLDNLQRLNLIRHDASFLPYGLSDRLALETDVDITPLGMSLVLACRPPVSPTDYGARDTAMWSVR
jgi:hypothetical protein